MNFGSQIRAGRALLNWGVVDLADKAGVAKNTVVRLEAGRGSNAASVTVITQALEAAGIQFTDDGERIGVTVAKGRGA